MSAFWPALGCIPHVQAAWLRQWRMTRWSIIATGGGNHIWNPFTWHRVRVKLKKNIGSLGERQRFGPKLWGHWLRMLFIKGRMCIELFEITNLMLTLKNYWFWVTRQKKKCGVIEWQPSIFDKNVGSLGDNGAENGGVNSPTYAAPQKWECPSPPQIATHRSGKVYGGI